MDITGLFSSFGGVAYTFVAFIVALSIIVAVHEYGHYIVGRWCGIKALVFSIGFGPVLFSRTDKRGTVWQIAALPFGGYVKFLGDANAASGKDAEGVAEMDQVTLRQSMHGAPVWARAATAAAGPVFNFIMSILVFGAVIMARGQAIDPPTIASIKPLPAAIGELRDGDAILSIAGVDVGDFEQFYEAVEDMPVRAPLDYRVLRDGQEVVVDGPYPFPALVAGVQPDSAALDVGIEVGDVVVSADGQPIAAFSQLQDIVMASEGNPIVTEVWREGELLEFVLVPRKRDLPLGDGGFETRWLIGATGGLFFEAETASPGPLGALQFGVSQTGYIIQSSLSGLYHMVAGAISTCNLRGPLGIAETSAVAASQGIGTFVWFVAVLSTAVGLLNLFPIPILDGGHLVFHAYEAVRGKPPSDRAMQFLMTLGLALMLMVMLFSISNDLFCQ